MNFLEETSLTGIKRIPGSIAIKGKDFQSTYAGLREKVLSTASRLHGEKITPGEPVCILSGNNTQFIIIVLALWLIDAVPVPINTRLTEDEIGELVKIAGCDKLLVHKDYRGSTAGIPVRKILFPADNDSSSIGNITAGNTPEKTAVIIFTSGSSGTPKGVKLSFRNLISSASTGNGALNQEPGDSWLASLPFFHIGGFSIITRALLYGLTIIIPDSLETADIKFSFEQFDPSFASLVGTQFKRLLDSGMLPNRGLKNLLLGGGFIEDVLVEPAIAKGWNISKVYGSSETSSFVTMLSGSELLSKTGSAGKAVPPNEIFIVDENHVKLPPNSSGEIAVKSGAVMEGYVNNKVDTAKKLDGGLYYSGDVGYLDGEGYLFIEARRNDLIISGGENINPEEIETAISGCSGVEDCCVIGVEDKTWGQAVAAAIVKSDDKISAAEIKANLKKKLAGFKIPKEIIFVEKIPRTPLGKIEKVRVRELFD